MSEEEDGDRDKALVAEYALGLLEPAEHAAVAARLRREPELRRELALWQRHFAGLSAEVAPVEPPPGLFDRVEQRLFAAPPKPRFGLWENLTFWRGIAAACLVIAVVAVGANYLLPRPLPTGAELVAALEAQGSNVKFVALYDAASGTVRLVALSGAAVPDKDFELWAIKGAAAPVSMGVIPIDAASRIALSAGLRAGFGAGTVLAISLEPKGGSPTGQPTGPIVAQGAARSI